MNQSTLDEAVKIATKRALSGKPVSRIVWSSPVCGSDNQDGCFLIFPYEPLSIADTPPWEN